MFHRPLCIVGAALAFALPASGQLSLYPVATGLSAPLYVGSPAADSRLFVAEKEGKIRIIQNGVLLPDPFLDVGSLINTESELGLIGMTFDPAFATNGRFYVDFIEKGTTNVVVSRYQSTPGSNVADPASRQEIIKVLQYPDRTFHKGGWLAFRPGDNNNLYISTGDGGIPFDPDNNAQNLQDLRGKILRLDVSGNTAGYAIPAGNLFAKIPGAKGEIWSYGLRNPFRGSFDRLTGDMYLGDVGEGNREEIDFEAAANLSGQNYGWRAREGTTDDPEVPDPTPADAVDPIYDYNARIQRLQHASVIGGYVYRGSRLASLYGAYVFGDFVNGEIWSLRYDGTQPPSFTDLGPQLNPQHSILGDISVVTFGEDAAGELYVADIGGRIYQIVPEPAAGVLLVTAIAVLGVRRRR